VEILETVQSSFLKYSLNLPKCTPNYIVRTEVNRPKLEYKIFRRAFKFLAKILDMEENRLPKLVWQKLLFINQTPDRSNCTNWASQLQLLMNKVDPNIKVGELTGDEIRENYQEWENSFLQKLYLEDIQRVVYSSCNTRYKSLLSPEPLPHYLINSDLSPNKSALVAQLRCCPDFYYRIKLYSYSQVINSDSRCQDCENNCNLTWHHIIFCCRKYSEVRTRFLKNFSNVTYENFIDLIRYPTESLVEGIHDFLLSYLR